MTKHISGATLVDSLKHAFSKVATQKSEQAKIAQLTHEVDELSDLCNNLSKHFKANAEGSLTFVRDPSNNNWGFRAEFDDGLARQVLFTNAGIMMIDETNSNVWTK